MVVEAVTSKWLTLSRPCIFKWDQNLVSLHFILKIRCRPGYLQSRGGPGQKRIESNISKYRGLINKKQCLSATLLCRYFLFIFYILYVDIGVVAWDWVTLCRCTVCTCLRPPLDRKCSRHLSKLQTSPDTRPQRLS